MCQIEIVERRSPESGALDSDSDSIAAAVHVHSVGSVPAIDQPGRIHPDVVSFDDVVVAGPDVDPDLRAAIDGQAANCVARPGDMEQRERDLLGAVGRTRP